jgi:hypothetical protein
MRNYEVIKAIYEIVRKGSASVKCCNSFKNTYLNDVIAIQKLIEEERPELVEKNG